MYTNIHQRTIHNIAEESELRVRKSFRIDVKKKR